jgi:hypothetical protein
MVILSIGGISGMGSQEREDRCSGFFRTLIDWLCIAEAAACPDVLLPTSHSHRTSAYIVAQSNDCIYQPLLLLDVDL